MFENNTPGPSALAQLKANLKVTKNLIKRKIVSLASKVKAASSKEVSNNCLRNFSSFGEEAQVHNASRTCLSPFQEECHDSVIDYTCVICLVNFKNEGSSQYINPADCEHKTCVGCMKSYIQLASRTQILVENNAVIIRCPGYGCPKELSLINMHPLLYPNDKKKISLWWSYVLEKSYIKNKIVCPFSECGAIFEADITLSRKCTFTKCYECHRGFCSACQDKWHDGIIKILDTAEESIELLQAAERNFWSRCPNCFLVIQKSGGCHRVRCFCGKAFCFRCGGSIYGHMCDSNCHRYTAEELTHARKKMFEKYIADKHVYLFT